MLRIILKQEKDVHSQASSSHRDHQWHCAWAISASHGDRNARTILQRVVIDTSFPTDLGSIDVTTVANAYGRHLIAEQSKRAMAD